MKCPKDQTKLNVTIVEGVSAMSCSKCKGVWLDYKHLLALGIGKDKREKITPVEGASALKCPSDQHQLVTIKHHKVEIDICPSCHGIWFDRDEVSKTIDEQINQRSNEEMNILWWLPEIIHFISN